MYPKKDSFLTLSSEIDLFINKYYKHELVRGIMLSFVFLVFLLSGAWFLESLFRFSSLGRGVLFFGASLFALIYISKLTLFPLIKLFGVHGRMSHEEASVLLSKKIPEIGDQLVNAIGLGKQLEKTETDLLRASIEQKALNSLKFDFRGSISIHDQRKMLFGFLVLFLISGACSFIYPDSIIPPLKRVVFFQKSFDKPIPFEFEVNNGRPLEVLENEPLEISIKTIGKTDPEQIFLYSKKKRFFPEKTNKKSFKYVFNSVNKSFVFKLLDGNRDTVDYSVVVLPRARIIKEKKIVTYPSYTQIENDTFYDLNRIIVPEGSVVDWEIKCKSISFCSAVFEDSVISSEKEMFGFSYSPKKSQAYKIFVRNSFSDFLDSSSYFIELNKDGFPTIELNEVVDSNKVNKRLFLGDISDDYGFHSLKFYCLRNDSIIYSELLKYNGTNRAVFNFEFDFEGLSLKSGDLIHYYFAVKDNDGINGPKEVLSRSMFLKVPSKERQKEIRKIKSLANNQSFSSLRKKLQNFNSELEEIKTSMLNKKSLNWEDKSSLENFLKKQKEMQKELEKLKNQLQEEFSEGQIEKNKEILKKQEQISKMMEELMTDEMKKLYDELSKLSEEMNKDKILKKLEDVDFAQEDMLKELNRTIEHFKKMEIEQKAKELSQELKDLSNKQSLLKEKTVDKNVSGFEKNKIQEKIKEDFNKIQSELSDLKNKNKELSKPLKIETEENEKKINQSIEETLEKIGENKMKKASEKQGETSKSLDELAESMKKLSKGSGDKPEEDMESLRVLLEQLITFSLDQEEVLADLKSTKTQDPKYIDIGQQQRKLSDKIQIIDDSLTALALRQIMLSGKINKEVQSIKRSLKKSIKNLTERQTKNAQIEQQTVMMHTNELGLLLSEIINQMQQNMPGSGQCNKPGGKNKKPGNGLPKNAEQLKQQIEAMKKFMKDKKGGKKPGESGDSFEQLGRMAAQQAAIKKQLQEMAQELNKDGSGKGNAFKDLIKKIEETEDEIINNEISLSTIKRQEEIKVKLLELDRATKEQEEEEKREAKESLEDYKKNNSVLFEEYLQIKKGETELLKTIPPNLKPYYKNKVNEYFKSIEKDYD
jgi:hypothetical protein